MNTENVSADMPEYRSGYKKVVTDGQMGKSDRQVLIDSLKALDGIKKKLQGMLDK